MRLKFTVVTVVYNAEKVIKKTIESVLNQSYAVYEYLIFDGLSSDNTLEVVNGYADAFAAKGIRYKVVCEKDTGIYNAMNKGVDAATGDFISFLNAGDWYEPDAVESVQKLYDEEAFDLTYGGLHYIKADGTITNKMSKLDTFPVSSRHWNHPSMFLKSEIHKQNHFNESFCAYADFDLYLKLRKSGTKIRILNKIVTNFMADGLSTDANIIKVLARSKEKYRAYVENGYSRIYWLESYGWEMMKAVYLRLHS